MASVPDEILKEADDLVRYELQNEIVLDDHGERAWLSRDAVIIVAKAIFAERQRTIGKISEAIEATLEECKP